MQKKSTKQFLQNEASNMSNTSFLAHLNPVDYRTIARF